MTTSATGVTIALVDYAQSLKYEDIPPEVLERTKQMLLDFLGVAYGGLAVGESSAPIIDGVLDLAAGAQGRSAVVGRAEKLPAHYAALLNATFAHSMDFDDTHREAVIHIGTPLFATLLALADESDVSGRDFLTAAVAGYDVTGKVGKAHGGAVHARGSPPNGDDRHLRLRRRRRSAPWLLGRADCERSRPERQPVGRLSRSSSRTGPGTSASTLA